tara:strand:- start:4465 stop:6540 length:2076 start_codon:yes stop_codon:yes gene_type:complete
MRWFSHTRRLSVICWRLFAQLRALRRFDPQSYDARKVAGFVDGLIALGPTFVKLGQIMSTRSDILPEAYIAELERLQERAPTVSFEVIKARIEAELGASLSAHFATFDSKPVAAASLAQVHKATLMDGTVVAVKVQRPDMDALFARDLDALDFGIAILRKIAPRKLRRANLVAFLAEFRRYTQKELDFASESQMMARFGENFAGHDVVIIPKTYPALTTRRVLTMDWVEGMRLHEAAVTLTDEKKQALVSGLVDVLLKMFVSDGLFHADLHPGNIIFHRDGRFTLLDFGMSGDLTGLQRDRFILYWMAVVQRQTRRAFHHFNALTEPLENANERVFFERFESLAQAFYTAPLRDTSLAKIYLEMMQAGYRNGYVFPASLMLHAKALTSAEALLFVLAPEARFEDLSRPYIAREYAARATSPENLAKRASQILPELLLLGEVLPQSAKDDEWDWAATKSLGQDLLAQMSFTHRHSARAMLHAFVERYARPILVATAHDLDVSEVLRATWARYDELETDLPVADTVGAMLTTHLAALTLAVHDSLVAQGMGVQDSYDVVYQIGWSIYERMSKIPLILAKTMTKNPHKQMRIATDMFRQFPFGSPGYGWRDVDIDPNVVGFDCTKCPVATFFKEQDAAQLCVKTWCALDYPLAQKWGGRLERCGTLAAGNDHCDFRWHTDPMGSKIQQNLKAKT